MNRHILLDSSPLGLLSNPANTADVIAITQWAAACYAGGDHLYIPEVIDYELRRELLRAGKTKGIAKLDSFKTAFRYLAITTVAMLRAAELWSQARRSGLPTSDPKKLDIDVILAAQALTLPVSPTNLIIATSNVTHISRFAPAALWTDIKP